MNRLILLALSLGAIGFALVVEIDTKHHRQLSKEVVLSHQLRS